MHYWFAPFVSFFLVLMPLGAQGQDRDLPAAPAGAVYAHALEINRPAYFEKTAGNADWLTVTHDGILTGRPHSGDPRRAEITVTAYPLDASGHRDLSAKPLVRSFVVPVEENRCMSGGGQPLAWCDAAPDAGPPQNAPRSAFSPKNQEFVEVIQKEGQEILNLPPECAGTEGCIMQFNRLLGADGEVGTFDPAAHSINWHNLPLTGELETQVIDAINASKVLISGSVFIYEHVKDCKDWDWSVVAQTTESSNNLVYEPSDLAYFCVSKVPQTSPTAVAQTGGTEETVLIVLPVHAIWASVYPRSARKNDPNWRASSTPHPKVCDWARNGQSLRPCDVSKNTPLRRAGGWVYNRLALPGVSQGSISVSPIMPATKSTWDVQLYTSTLLGPGWAGFQLMYEHDRKSSDDLNSLTAAWTYDVRIPSNAKNFWAEWGSEKADDSREKCGPGANGDCRPPYVGLRPPELNLRVGPEYSPDAFSYTPKLSNAAKQYLPRDLNLVGAATLRVPIIVSLPIGTREPSQLSISPVGGLEGGVRMISDGILTAMPCPFSEPSQCAQPQTIFRRVGGFDASSRWPYNLFKNFLGDKPVMVDYSYRIRWLTHEEPFSNQELVIRDNDNIAAHGAAAMIYPTSGQSLGARVYQRITFIAPFSAYLQLRATWQHGSLPPVFQFVGNEVSVGLAFSNPGSSEH